MTWVYKVSSHSFYLDGLISLMLSMQEGLGLKTTRQMNA